MDKQRLLRGVLHLTDSIVGLIIIIAVLPLLAFGIYALWDANTIVDAARPAQYEIYKPNQENGQKTFDELVAMNKDVLGWLTVYGTNIDYPLVKTDNNNTYLTQNAEGEYSMSGAIFLDYRNDSAFADFNTIIYGHHMDKDVMFGDISDFKDESFFQSHEYGSLYYEGAEHGIEFFSFIETDAFNAEVFSPGITGVTSCEKYLKNLNETAMYSRDLDVTVTDNLVLLSTCTSDITNGRHLLVGRVTNSVLADAFAEPLEKQTSEVEIPAAGAEIPFETVPIWLLALMVLIPVLLVFLLIHELRKQA